MYDLKGFTDDEIATIINALARQVPLIVKISTQVAAQQAKPNGKPSSKELDNAASTKSASRL